MARSLPGVLPGKLLEDGFSARNPPLAEKRKMQHDKSLHDDDLFAPHSPAAENDDCSEKRLAAGGGHQVDPEHWATPAQQDALSAEKAVTTTADEGPPGVTIMQYESELQLPHIMRLMKADLSEPYSIYTYRYFIHNWPNLCFLAMCDGKYVGAVVCKMEAYSEQSGYIAMLAVDKDYRKRKIGSTLVKMTIKQMAAEGCCEVVLETEVTNKVALSLYENLGFIRERYLHQYYLNGVDAYRLKLWLRII